MRLPWQGADQDASLHAYFLFQREFGVRDGRVARQVHGATILCANGLPRMPIWPVVVGEGDAIWTSEPGTWVGVFTADCLAVLLDGGDRVMAVHAGWRGFAAGILRAAVDVLGGPDRVRSATLNPCACACCYEVGDEVLEGIRRAGIDPVTRGRNLDLADTAERHLGRLGIGRIVREPGFSCSICTPGLASYRRDGAAAGRNLSVIALSG